MKEDNNQDSNTGVYLIYVFSLCALIYTSANSLLNMNLSILNEIINWITLIVSIIALIRITYFQFRK